MKELNESSKDQAQQGQGGEGSDVITLAPKELERCRAAWVGLEKAVAFPDFWEGWRARALFDEGREAALREELEGIPDVSIKNCIFEGENRDGSQAFEFEISEGCLNKLTKINLDGWLCYGPSGGNPIDALQQRLTVAEQRLGDAYEWGYGDGQNSPNGYSDKEDRDKCVADLLKPAEEDDSDLQKIGFVRMNTKTDQPRISLADMQARYEDKP